MRLRLILFLIVGFLMLAVSCYASCAPQTRLADIPAPSLMLFVPEPPWPVSVKVLPEHIRFKGPCKLPAPNARATLNGVRLKRLRGKHVGKDMMYDRDCIVEFAVAVDAIPKAGTGALLRISDDSATWLLKVPTAFAPRSFTLVPPDQRIVRRGERVVIKWSPSTDRIDGTGIGFELHRAGSPPGTGTAIRDIDVRGDELSFTAPAGVGEAAWNGPALLRFLGPYHVKPALGPCPVRDCLVTMGFAVPSVAVTVED